MSWQTLSPEFRALIKRVCTPKEIEAVKLKAAGYGRRRTSVALGISEEAVRDRLRRAERKIQAAINELGGLG